MTVTVKECEDLAAEVVKAFDVGMNALAAEMLLKLSVLAPVIKELDASDTVKAAILKKMLGDINVIAEKVGEVYEEASDIEI